MSTIHLLQVKEKPKLSAEEARKQAEDVLRKAKQKREVRKHIQQQRFACPSHHQAVFAGPGIDLVVQGHQPQESQGHGLSSSHKGADGHEENSGWTQ